MRLPADGRSFRFLFSVSTLTAIFALFVCVLFAAPDGNERVRLFEFFGRFHPISVHLPIALLMLVPLFELAGRRREISYLLLAVDFVLGVAVLAAIAAATLGWLLARNGAYTGPLVTQHMWGGLGVAVAAWLCWVLRSQNSSTGSAQTGRAYFGVLAATVALVSFTGYRGGQLSQGENHLTEFMPAPFNEWLGGGSSIEAPANSPNGGPNTFYGARIQPILSQHCDSCHGRSKHKSNLRLDSYEAVMHGGKHGLVVKASDTKTSELFRRITLPPSNDDFMPPQNKRPLSEGEVKLIEQWITAGASGTQLTEAFKGVAAIAVPVAEVIFEEVDLAEVTKQRASIASVVTQLQQRFPNVLEYQTRGSAQLALNASWMGAKFGDNDLAAFAPVADHIVLADLSNTAITDKSGSTIAAMKHLHTLRLMHTKVVDATVQSFGTLAELETLSLFDTPVTAAALPALSKMPGLRHVYIGETKISDDAALPQAIKDKAVF